MPVRLLQAALLLAAAGAIVLLVDLFGTVGLLVGLGAIVLGTVLAAPAARGESAGWWNALAAGALLCGAGAALGQLSEIAGGLLTVLGSVAVLASAALTMPLR